MHAFTLLQKILSCGTNMTVDSLPNPVTAHPAIMITELIHKLE